MVKEIERAGIPVVHMATVVPISLTIGANRIIPGVGIPYPLEGVKPPTMDRVKNAKALMHTETYQEYKNRVGVKTLD